MRMTRWFVAGLVSAALIPASASAQRVKDFEDSWFWGVKGGVSTYTPVYFNDAETGATYGAEWLITRTRGALYVSVDQTNVNAISAVLDGADGSVRPVEVDKLRRIGFAALAFPKRFGKFRPYGGIGLAISQISGATPLLTADEEDVDESVYDRIDERKSQSSFLAMGGLQMQLGKAAVFGQASYIPVNSRFLLDDGIGFFEFGVRYNFGSAREGIR